MTSRGVPKKPGAFMHPAFFSVSYRDASAFCASAAPSNDGLRVSACFSESSRFVLLSVLQVRKSQMVVVHRVFAILLDTLLERPNGKRREPLLVVHPSKGVVDFRHLRKLRFRRLRVLQGDVEVPAGFG